MKIENKVTKERPRTLQSSNYRYHSAKIYNENQNRFYLQANSSHQGLF